MMDYMSVSLYDESVLFLYREIRLQSNKDSHKSTFRYVYALSGYA